MQVFHCHDIMRFAELVHRYDGPFCLDIDMPGTDKFPGVIGYCHSTPEKYVCEYANGEIPSLDIDVILINKFSLNIIGGALALNDMKPEDDSFWHDAARYTPYPYEDFAAQLPGLDPLNVARIRAFDFDFNAYRLTIASHNTGDISPALSDCAEKLRYILSASNHDVYQLAEERTQHLASEWRKLNSKR